MALVSVYDLDGSYRSFDTADLSPNTVSLLQKAQTALTNNATFLAIATPTTAQAVAQVAALTRQVNALIRLTVGQLDSTDGT